MSDPELIEELAAAVIIPPDGGWGWVIVAASFFCNMIVDGIIFTAGSSFQRNWEDQYGVTSGVASWVVSLLSGCYLCVGPVVSVLANIFGSRLVVMAGTLLAATGFILSMFAPSIPILIITFGLLGGVGFGFIYMPSIVMVSHYFQRRRALATGIAVCGSGIGTFVFAPLFEFLNDHYANNMTQILLIVTAITLHCLVFGAFYRELEPSRDMIRALEKKFEEEQQAERVLSEEDLARKASQPKVSTTRSHASSDASDEPPSHPGYAASQLVHRNSQLHRSRTVSRRSRHFVDELGRDRQISLFSLPDAAEFGLMASASKTSIKNLNRPMFRGDVFYTGSVTHLPQFQLSHRDISKYIASTTNLDDVVATGEGTDLAAIRTNFKATLRSLLDISLFRSPTFVVLCVSGFLTLAGFFVPFVYLPRYALSVGIGEREATFLLSILGITNIVARILCGWLSDHPKLNALMINNVALTIGGLVTMVVPHLTRYWTLVIYCVVFGFGTACFASLRSVICVELLGLERLNNAFGLMLMFLGLASLVGIPLAGFLYDATGNFELSFYIAGALIALSGVVGFPLERLKRWEDQEFDRKPHETKLEMIQVAIPEEEEEPDA